MQQIERIMDMLVAAFGPMGPVYVLGAFGLILVGTAVPLLLLRRPDPIEKLGRARPEAKPRRAAGRAPAERLRHDQSAGKLDALAPLFEPADADKASSAREMLMQAGYRSRGAVRKFYMARGLGAAAASVIGLLYVLLRSEPTLMNYALGLVGGGFAGYMAPNYWVSRKRQARQQEIGDSFPDALDMMLICVEAGQSLDQSLMRVANEIAHAHPALSEEFQIISVEIRAGKERAQVLRDFAARSGVRDVGSFVTVLIQSTQFGTSIAEALRVYAAEMRDKRVMRAEEKANKLPTKLTLGTMFFTVPPLLLILIGPSLVDIINALGKMKN